MVWNAHGNKRCDDYFHTDPLFQKDGEQTRRRKRRGKHKSQEDVEYNCKIRCSLNQKKKKKIRIFNCREKRVWLYRADRWIWSKSCKCLITQVAMKDIRNLTEMSNKSIMWRIKVWGEGSGIVRNQEVNKSSIKMGPRWKEIQT